MQQSTNVFLVKKDGERITEVCLAMKKRGFGKGKWNGSGGKVNDGETIEAAAKREVTEEINVQILVMNKAADMTMTFPDKPEWDKQISIYLATAWEGEPTESEEMRPKWFQVEDIPYDEMWSTDKHWLPRVLEGEILAGSFQISTTGRTIDYQIELAS